MAPQISVTQLFSSDFDSICDRLHGLIRACISHDSNVGAPFKLSNHFRQNKENVGNAYLLLRALLQHPDILFL